MSAHSSTQSRPAISPYSLACLLVLIAALVPAAASAEDLRTRTLRLVPTKTFTQDPGATYTVLAATHNSEHAKADSFIEHMRTAMIDALERLDYQIADSEGTVTYAINVDVYDPGSAAMRFGVGFGAGKGYTRGTLEIKRKSRVVGQYAFSARLRGAGTKSLAKEVGPAIVLQLHKGNVDTELHEYKKEKKDS